MQAVERIAGTFDFTLQGSRVRDILRRTGQPSLRPPAIADHRGP
jgi:hypothetical protein